MLIVAGVGVVILGFLFFITIIFRFAYPKVEPNYDDDDIEITELEQENPEADRKEKEQEKRLEEKADRSFEHGKKQALKDVRQGKLIVYQNRFAGASQAYKALMLKKYGVKINEGGDAVSSEELGFNSGYNSVSIPAIEKKFGKGIIQRVEKELNQKAEEKLKLATEKEVEKGRQLAKNDIKRGKIIVFYSDSEESDQTIIKDLSNEHKIEFIAKRRSENLPLTSGYNEISMKHIKEKIGIDAFMQIKLKVKFIAIKPYSF
jgi:hypothetical protein